jgi:hypothetical protein
MKKFISITVFCILLGAVVAHAQDMVPATSEDIDQFDQQLSRQMSDTARGSKDKSRFGQTVSDEAKKQKDADSEKKKNFGKWVSGQRRKNDDGRPDAAGSAAARESSGKDSSDSSDVRGSAPGNSDSAGSHGRGKGNANGNGSGKK